MSGPKTLVSVQAGVKPWYDPIMPLFIVLLIVCTGLWLLFPKSFKYLVGTWVGVAFGGFGWGLAFGGLFMAGVNPSWAVMGYSFLGFIIAGIFGGCLIAARE